MWESKCICFAQKIVFSLFIAIVSNCKSMVQKKLNSVAGLFITNTRLHHIFYFRDIAIVRNWKKWRKKGTPVCTFEKFFKFNLKLFLCNKVIRCIYTPVNFPIEYGNARLHINGNIYPIKCNGSFQKFKMKQGFFNKNMWLSHFNQMEN